MTEEQSSRNVAIESEGSLLRLFYVTVISNFARGFDKYSRFYSKSTIPESSFPSEFYLLPAEELTIGVLKTTPLLLRLRASMPGDRLVAIETRVPSNKISPNEKTGKGVVLGEGRIPVHAVWDLAEGKLHQSVRIEDAIAVSLSLLSARVEPAGSGTANTVVLQSWESLVPRTVSLLPIAKGCQARCRFCFSEASVSADQERGAISLSRMREVLREGAARGASRCVITGGGEPTLLRHDKLIEMIAEGAAALPKTVLITTGYSLASATEELRRAHLIDYDRSGLTILSVSRHHWDEATNSRIMNLETLTPRVLLSARDLQEEGLVSSLKTRLICVLQKGGVETCDDVEAYLNFAVAHGVNEVCFKELYVSSSVESIYYARGANDWSYAHQVPLAVVIEFARRHGFRQEESLPWGSPIYTAKWAGKTVRLAAYTEPSVLWERMNGVARSWNLMADGTILSSLEDKDSLISVGGTEE